MGSVIQFKIMHNSVHDDKKLTCSNEDCNYSTRSKRHLRNHCESVHLKSLKYACSLCDYKSYYKPNVIRHQDLYHIDIQQKVVLKIGCNLCENSIKHEKHTNRSYNPRLEKLQKSFEDTKKEKRKIWLQ